MPFSSSRARNGSAKCAAVVCLLCLLPLAAWAHSSVNFAPASTCIPGVAVCIDNQGGTASGGKGGLFLDGTHGSVASTVVEIGGLQGANLGSLTLTTGALLTGSLSGGGTFAAGTLTVTTSGWNGFSGVLFSGTFGNSSTPIQWIALGKVGKFYEYELVGPISGSWEGGGTVAGETAQLLFHCTKPFTGAPGQTLELASGTTAVVVPEEGTIALMGTGLLGMGLLARRKARRGGADWKQI